MRKTSTAARSLAGTPPTSPASTAACGGRRAGTTSPWSAWSEAAPAEAADLLRAAVAEDPAFLPSWYALGDLAVRSGDWAECDRIAERVRRCGPDGEVEAERLIAEGRAGREEVASALRGLEQALEKYPHALPLRLVESRLRVQDASDPAAAERAVRAVLALAPDHPVARRHLETLRARPGEGMM